MHKSGNTLVFPAQMLKSLLLVCVIFFRTKNKQCNGRFLITKMIVLQKFLQNLLFTKVLKTNTKNLLPQAQCYLFTYEKIFFFLNKKPINEMVYSL